MVKNHKRRTHVITSLNKMKHYKRKQLGSGLKRKHRRKFIQQHGSGAFDWLKKVGPVLGILAAVI